MDILASPPGLDGSPGTAWALTVELGDLLSVREAEVGSRLPSFCPELHVNEDGPFCIGNRKYEAAQKDDVSTFWHDLRVFLLSQDYFARRGSWPHGRWLSHGAAADHQVEAERLAAEGGWSEEYSAWLENGEGWLGGPLPRLSKDDSRLVNARAPCPRGCRSRRGHILVRASCERRFLIEGLVKAEYKRRSAEKDFFESLYRRDKRCCRRVEGCPLAALEDQRTGQADAESMEVQGPPQIWKLHQRKRTGHARTL